VSTVRYRSLRNAVRDALTDWLDGAETVATEVTIECRRDRSGHWLVRVSEGFRDLAPPLEEP
jgi:hypothetical protein